MAGRATKTNTSPSGFDPAEKLNSNTLKCHPKMDLSRSDLLQLLSYLEGELQARDVVIATLKAEKAKQLLYQAKYGRFGLGDPFSAMQRDSDNMQDNTFDESAIRSMYDSQLAQLENLIATQRKAQMKMREQLVAGDRRYQKVCNELEDEKRKHAQDTAQGDDVTYMLEKERERLKQEVDFEKANVKKMEKDMKKTLANLEEERTNSLKHKQVALMLIKERKKLVEKMMQEKHRADQAEKLLAEERVESMNMAEGIVEESKKSLKMEATMERQASEFDVEREQLKHKLLREENRNKELHLQIESLSYELENLQKQSMSGKTLPKDSVHSVEIKSNIVTPHLKLSSDRMPGWSLSNSPTSMLLSGMPATSHYEHEAELSPRTVSSELSVRKRDNNRYASPPAASVERMQSHYTDVERVAPVGAVSDKHMFNSHGGHKLNVSIGGPSVVTSTGWITVQTSNPPVLAGQVSPRRVINVGHGTPPPIPPNKPIVPVTSPPKQLTPQNVGTALAGYKPVHIPVTVVHTSTITAPPGARTPKRDGSPSTIRKPAQFAEAPHISHLQASCNTPPTSDSFDFLGPEMADLQQLLVSMVSDPEDSSAVGHHRSSSLLDSPSHVQTSSVKLMTSSVMSSVPSSVTSLVTSSGQQTTATIHESSSPSTEQPLKPLHRWSDSPQTPSTLSTADSKFVSSVMVLAPNCPSDRLSTTIFTVPKIPITTPVVKDIPTSPIHRYAATGNVQSLRKLIVDLEADVNLPMKDGTTPAHCAAENGQDECLRILLECGCSVNSLCDNKQTPLHCAAARGQSRCLSLLLHNGGNVHTTDHVGWTPLHWAAKNGHLDCCRLLLTNGANRLAISNINWTPLHVAVHSDASDCLDLFLTFNMDQSTSLRELRQAVCQLVDKDGWTLAYLAASRASQECLSVILRYCEIDLKYKDHCGRSIMDVSSPSCQCFFKPYVNREKLKHVLVAMRCSGPLYVEQEPFLIGHVQILPNMDWTDVDSVVTDCVESYFEQLDNGLRTKKVVRLDPETTGDGSNFTLGLSRDSIDSYNIGTFFWKREVTNLDQTPQELLCVATNPTIIVTLKGGACDHDSLAFDLLMPVSTVNNYTRMLDQYHSLMFYGPSGTRKEQLVKKLARHIVERKKHGGYKSHIMQVYLHRDYRHQDFVQLMKTEGCLLPVGMTRDQGCILLLFHLEKVDLLKMLGGLLEHIEHRGSQHTFTLQDTNDTTKDLYYFCDNFYLITTMDKPRSIGVDLGLQQRFRWVCLRVKAEPMKNFLGRHLLRRLLHNFGGKMPSVDDDLFKVVEWLLCVWHRLNDGVVKLGLPDIVFGPEIFLTCPLEAQDCQAVLDWLRQLWNEIISSAVRTTVLKGTADGQQKVANTALYVLMQRAIVPGCPFNGQEKESYLSNFCGSNELDVPLNSDRLSPGTSSVGLRRPLHNGNCGNSKELTHAKTKHRNSTDVNFSPAHTVTSINNKNSVFFKRSSLSETLLVQADEIAIPAIHQSSDPSSDIQAKVPKLEIQSPVLVLSNPLSKYFSESEPTSPSSITSASPSSQRRSTFSTQSRIPHPSSKRSRSSENLAITQSYPVGGSSGIKQTGPFSFSLTMPTSPLFSFKFMEEGSTSTILSTSSNMQTMENR